MPSRRPLKAVGLRAEFHARDFFQAQERAVGIGADDDLAELFRTRQPARRAHRVCEFLARRRGLATDLARGIDGVLRAQGVDDVGDRDAQFRELVRLHPEPHRVLARAENLHVGNARHARDLVDQIDVRVVGQEDVVVGALWANSSAMSSSGAVVDFWTVTPAFMTSLRQLRAGLVDPHLGQDVVDIRIGPVSKFTVMRIEPFAFTDWM